MTGAWPAKMKVVCQGNRWTEWEGTTTQEDKTALMVGVSLGTLDKYSETLRICGGIYLEISHIQVQSRIKSSIHFKFTSSEESEEAKTAGSLNA